MNYTNEVRNEEMQKNNRAYKGINYNPNNIKIPRRKNKIKTDINNNYQEIKEFKSQEDLVFLKKLKPTKSFEPYIKSGNNNIVNNKINMNNEYNEFNDYNEYNDQYINKGINKTNTKSNSSIKINTKVNCKKYFTSKKMRNNNENMTNQISNKGVINSNINNNVSSNNYNIVYPGQNSVKMNGKKMINYYNNVNNNNHNNKNNNLTMTKSSIQIKGNYPLTQSQNIYQLHTQSKVESIALNVDVDNNNNNSSQDKYNKRENIENSNNKERSIQNRYINNQNYHNKTHLVKREFNNKEINYNYDNNNNNLTPKLVQNKNIKMNSNGNLMENIENRTNRVNNNYTNYNYNINNSNRSNKTIHKIKNNLTRTTQVEMEKANQFVKNNNDEYNNIFFYTSNTNKNTTPNYNNELKENKYNYQYRENNDFIYNALDDDNNMYNNSNYNINLISNKKENKMKKKFIYKKSGNLSDNKLQKLISNKNNSQSKPSINNNNESQNIEKLQNNLTKGKKTINRINKTVKRDKSNEIIPLKSKRSYEITKRQFKENKNVKNYTIKQHEMKLRKKKSFDSIDIKIKLPPDDREEIISINIKKGNVGERIENIIKEFSLDESYYEPLLSLVNNSINILNNIDSMTIYKSVKNENEKLGEENEEVTSSETNNLDLSVIIDLIEKNKFKEYIEDIYSDNEEIIDNAKILNLSI